MRTREEIEQEARDIGNSNLYEGFQNQIIIELLLDIRDLLAKSNNK